MNHALHKTGSTAHQASPSALTVVPAAPGSTRDLILDAAERGFAERGFETVSMRELAAAAGLKNQASLYNHFPNKRAIYEAVLARGIAPIVAVITASTETTRASTPASGDADVNVARFIDLTLDYLIAHPHLPRLIQRAALDDAQHLRDALTRLLRPLYGEGMRALATAAGSWPAAELPHLAAALYQLIFGYFANAKLLETVVDTDPLGASAMARQRRFVRCAVAQLLAGGPAAPPKRV